MKTYCMKCRKETGNIDPKIGQNKKQLISYAIKMFCLWN